MNSMFSLGSNPKTAHYICTNNPKIEKNFSKSETVVVPNISDKERSVASLTCP